jgi:DNA polymerase III epsilon subunit-like protein
MRFFVLDTETTDLDSIIGRVVDVAAVRVDLKERTVAPIFDSLVNPGLTLKELRATWICTVGGLNPGAVLAAPSDGVVALRLADLFRYEDHPQWTSYNAPFDEAFLTRQPWLVSHPTLPCLMRAAAPVCKIPSPYEGYEDFYKWPSLEEAYRILLGRESPGSHRALMDAARAGEIAIELHRLGAWP